LKYLFFRQTIRI